MASIIGKTIKGQTYYYLREVARVDGKPKIISQRYLGKAADIEAAVSGAAFMPDKTRHLAFGDLAAVWGMLERLGVAQIVDDVVGPRRSDAGASVGTYIALAVANRAVDPCSKRGFAEWWKTTAGDRFVPLLSAALDHRRFWEAMDAISENDLKQIERRVVARMVEVFGVDVSGLVLDMTNFATYIDSGNDRAPIAQRGHAKQKRTDLRIVGLGLVVSVDGGVPLVSHAYLGNKPDVTQFPLMLGELVARFGALGGQAGQLTLVFDAGQTPPTTPSFWRPPRCISSGRCRRPITPIFSPFPSTATAVSTPTVSPASPPSRPPRPCSVPNAASWSATPTACTPNNRQASTRHWPKPDAS
jgi:hypothetical protein